MDAAGRYGGTLGAGYRSAAKEIGMKAVMPVALPDVMAWRKQIGADRWDEMWDGVLHMPPPPILDHQDLEGTLETYLRLRWAAWRAAQSLS